MDMSHIECGPLWLAPGVNRLRILRPWQYGHFVFDKWSCNRGNSRLILASQISTSHRTTNNLDTNQHMPPNKALRPRRKRQYLSARMLPNGLLSRPIYTIYKVAYIGPICIFGCISWSLPH